jgi:hypothetical protein
MIILDNQTNQDLPYVISTDIEPRPHGVIKKKSEASIAGPTTPDGTYTFFSIDFGPDSDRPLARVINVNDNQRVKLEQTSTGKITATLAAI